MDSAGGRDVCDSGYLHNHARMWMAAYVVHWRRVQWQAGARWFLQHLLDGDPASNNLSWQWVASTFSHKPYIFNRENLERNTDGVYCRACPFYGKCAFEGSYEVHAARLFPDVPAIFVFDDALLEQYQISLKRIVFMYECLLELPVTIRRGAMVDTLLAFVDEHNATRIITTDGSSPHFAAVCKALRKTLPVVVLDEPPFLDYDGELDLGRFSRYWRVAQKFVT